MLDNTVLNVVIGLVFIFLLYSLLATAMQEAIANMLQRRANMLQYGIKCMLTRTINNNNLSKIGLIFYHLRKSSAGTFNSIKSFFIKKNVKTIHDRFYNHPIIKNYGQNSVFNKPSYLGNKNFSTILIETLKSIDPYAKNLPADFATIKKVLEDFNTIDPYDKHSLVYTPAIDETTNGIPETAPVTPESPRMDKETHNILMLHLMEAGGDLDVFRSRLEQWFSDTMDRVTGWYKKNTHYWLFGIGLFLAFTLNIDTIEISNYLSKNKAASEQLAKMGEAALASKDSVYNSQKSEIAKAALDTIKGNLQQVNTLVGLGWGDYGRKDTAFIKSIVNGKWYTPECGEWYTLFVSIKQVSLIDTFNMLAKKYQDSVQQLVIDSIKTDSANIAQDLAEIKSSKGKNGMASLTSDSSSYKQHTEKLSSVIAGMKKTKDSVIYVAFYDKISAECGWHVKAAYIRSRTKPQKFFGFFITALAIGLGAPFWYDLLSKVVSIKAAGKSGGTNASAATSGSNNDKIDG